MSTFEELTVEWRDGMGHTHREVFSGFPAIVLQHEMDHLDGVTFLDKSSNLNALDTSRRSRNSVKRHANESRLHGYARLCRSNLKCHC